MTIPSRQKPSGQGACRKLATAAAFVLPSWAGIALATADGDEEGGDAHHRYCSATASALFEACKSEARDDFFKAHAICINVADEEERDECYVEAKAQRKEAGQLCREQLGGRSQACTSLGEDRYDPDFDPALFDDNFANLPNPNPYFPLGIGYRWEYRGAGEYNTVEVTNDTKLIAGVRCIVVRDLVSKDGDLVEATDDWYAQAKDGNVWYCGEEVKDFESFDGDLPRRPELVSIDGSFKAGRNGDKAGVIFRAPPTPGEVYLEEFSLGNAEDVTEVLSTTYAFGSDAELDRFVPQALANLLCSGDCVVTSNYSLLEPGIAARKYYAPAIGFFLEVSPDTGEILQLTGCNVDSICGSLPPP